MSKSKIFTIAGIVTFCLSVIMVIFWNNISLQTIVDMQSFVFVAVSGGALAIAKKPKNLDDFLKYFSKTAILSGVLGAILGIIAVLNNMDSSTSSLMNNMAVAIISMFYGAVFSAVSYALQSDKTK